ncbi:ChaN family lipoprotein [Pseudorhodoferax sp. Leaf267]|uniref:ChaN family lipoprotein n=1 Tax=Pseudorhodoferax sp. Leaf267 TaxID=1736316 RepID=UPI0006F6937F|nr:ChaN family lipoprotein [Pseudorhodoferax sp. Leaf267]KQP12558.1 hypothetical protein ASF43_20115 [Pseudorhodoferax sp. Leaf267]
MRKPRSSPLSFLSRRWALVLAAGLLAGCVGLPGAPTAKPLALLPTDAILLGEQHDAPEHQNIHTEVVKVLGRRGHLTALVLEMVEQGRSTVGVSSRSDATAVRRALAWNDAAWPWKLYGPAVMAAVVEDIPVIGANLPRSEMGRVMQDASLDQRLPPAALQAQRDAILAGHCDLLPEAQIAPMTRVQIARDMAMAQAVVDNARPGGVVLLLAGSGHVDRALGVPRYLPPGFRAQAVRLQAGGKAEAAAGFDVVWPTPPVPPRDHCAELRPKQP